MRKLMIFAFLLAAATSWGYAQLREMPKEVRGLLENYTTDSTEESWFLALKNRGVIPTSVQFKDVRTRAIEVYDLNTDSIDMYADTVPLSEIIKPMGLWRVLVMAHNKPLYQSNIVYNRTESPKFSGGTFPDPDSGFRDAMWLSLLEAYPQSAGINPVLVKIEDKDMRFNVRDNFNGGNNFLYFKQLGSRKIYHIESQSRWSNDDTLKALFIGSIKTLDDSKKLVAYLKLNKDKINVANRIKLEKAAKGGSVNESIEMLEGSSGMIIRGKGTFESPEVRETLKKQKISIPTGDEQ